MSDWVDGEAERSLSVLPSHRAMQLRFSVLRNLLPSSCVPNKEVVSFKNLSGLIIESSKDNNAPLWWRFLAQSYPWGFPWCEAGVFLYPSLHKRSRKKMTGLWAHLTIKHWGNLWNDVNEMYQNIWMIHWKRDSGRCRCHRRRRGPKTVN